MNLDNLNRWLTLISNIAVLTGIVFLAIELQQNNLIAKAQTRSAITQTSVENTRLFQDPMSISAFTKLRNNEEVTQEEEMWLGLAFGAEFKAWQNIYYQYQVGLFDEADLEAYRVTWSNRFRSCRPIALQAYSNTRQVLEPKFRQEMDNILEQANCD